MSRYSSVLIACGMVAFQGCRESSTPETPPAVVRKVSPNEAARDVKSTVAGYKKIALHNLDQWRMAEGSFAILMETFRPQLSHRVPEYESRNLELDASPSLVKRCEEAISKKQKDPNYRGLFQGDTWDEDKELAEGESTAEYVLHRATVPIQTGNQYHCFDITIANDDDERTFRKTLRLFASQPVSSDDTWDGGDPTEDHSDSTGDSDLDRLKDWIKMWIPGEILGVRWLEVTWSESGQYRPGKMGLVYLAAKETKKS
jgi:hypothetical protein